MTKQGGSIQQMGAGNDEHSLMTLMGQMMRLPVTALVYSFEIFIRTMKEMQRMADQSFEAVAGDIKLKSSDVPQYEYSSGISGTGTDVNNQPTREEGSVMQDDQDLSGEDLKYVSYSILFTKRDLEATLEEQKQDLVNYSTNGGSYGGLKIAKFMEKVSKSKVKRPTVWEENDYPDDAVDDYHWTIPEEDEKYITFIYKVDRRLNRQEADYDKQKLDALKGIKSSIDSVGAKIG
jgi:hypothetical protein